MTDGLLAVAAVVALSITVEFVFVPVTVELVFVPVTVELTVLDDELTVFELEETVLDAELTVLPTVVLVVTVSVAKTTDTQKPQKIAVARISSTDFHILQFPEHRQIKCSTNLERSTTEGVSHATVFP
mgnify:FL=1|jgi:hypothetical protein